MTVKDILSQRAAEAQKRLEAKLSVKKQPITDETKMLAKAIHTITASLEGIEYYQGRNSDGIFFSVHIGDKVTYILVQLMKDGDEAFLRVTAGYSTAISNQTHYLFIDKFAEQFADYLQGQGFV